jgi:hypothetical protein
MVDFSEHKIETVQDFLGYVYDFYRSMIANKVNLVYEGEITHQITKAFTSLTETNMALEDESNTVQKKVFHVMVECLQNISKHADPIGENASGVGRGIFIVSKFQDEYTVTTGNIISQSKVPDLTEMLENINNLDKEGLKLLYKQQIRDGRLSEKGGAGLGFIDIARKTGKALEYHFLKVNDEYSFFILTSRISRNG